MQTVRTTTESQFRQELANRPYQTDHLNHTLAGFAQDPVDLLFRIKDLFSENFVGRPRFINGSLYTR